MSGGSWDYFYQRLADVADTLACSNDPLRRAFGKHLTDCATALHDIEWVDSCDYGEGDDIKAIKHALGRNAKASQVEEIRLQAERLLEQLRQVASEKE